MTEETVAETTRTEEDMELVDAPAVHEPKRLREEEGEGEGEDGSTKKQKVEDGGDEKSVEEKRSEGVKEGEEKGEDLEEEKEKRTEPEKTCPVGLGPKSFGSSVEMFDYFYEFLHYWSPNINVNKYEYLVLLDLLKKGHTESERKIGVGIKAFKVGNHPTFKSRCFFLVRDDDTVDDFSFRKCVDHILPLPENMRIKHDANKSLARGKGPGGRGGGGGRGGRGRGGSHGHGRR